MRVPSGNYRSILSRNGVSDKPGGDSHLDVIPALPALPASPTKSHIQARFNQFSEDTVVPPYLALIEDSFDITGSEYTFVGPRRLLSDIFEEHELAHPEFCRPFEWVSYSSVSVSGQCH